MARPCITVEHAAADRQPTLCPPTLLRSKRRGNRACGRVLVQSPNTSANTTSYGYNLVGDITGLTDANSHLTENASVEDTA